MLIALEHSILSRLISSSTAKFLGLVSTLMWECNRTDQQRIQGVKLVFRAMNFTLLGNCVAKMMLSPQNGVGATQQGNQCRHDFSVPS